MYYQYNIYYQYIRFYLCIINTCLIISIHILDAKSISPLANLKFASPISPCKTCGKIRFFFLRRTCCTLFALHVFCSIVFCTTTRSVSIFLLKIELNVTLEFYRNISFKSYLELSFSTVSTSIS